MSKFEQGKEYPEAVQNPKTIMQMKNICYRYGREGKEVLALNNVNLSVDAGEFVAVTGPSGSGKSTLIQIMGCMLTPTFGQYVLMNEDVASLGKNKLADIRNQHVGFVFQNFNLMARTSALYNVALPLIFKGIRKKKREEMALMALKRVGLEARAQHHSSELSGGEQQRVAIARAIVTRPTILLADEPTGNLDQKTGYAIMEIFQEMADDGITTIYVTHDKDLEKMATSSITLIDARIV